MTRDYSGRDPEALRLLCGVIAGADASVEAGDGRRLLAPAREHRVEGLFGWHLKRRGADFDAWFGDDRQAFEDELRDAPVIDALRTAELSRVVAALAAVPEATPVIFKGAALAHSHYPASWLRPRLDTDLIVPMRRLQRVFDALEGLGYRRAAATSGRLVTSQASYEHWDAFGLVHHLDVHWKVANWHAVANALSYDDLLTRAVPIPALGPAARAACASDALVLACLHRAAHHRDSDELLWIHDIHLIAQGLNQEEWQTALATAERGALRALCARGVALAGGCFSTRLPAAVVTQLDEWRCTPPPEASAVFLSKRFRLIDGLRSDLRALGMRAGLELIREHLFPPAAYLESRYGARPALAAPWTYLRRAVAGIPRWFSSDDRA